MKKFVALFLVVLMSIESFAAVVSDNDGAAFVTKAEFEKLKEDFEENIKKYNSSIDLKIDGAIANYLASITFPIQKVEALPYGGHVFWFTNDKLPVKYAVPNLNVVYSFRQLYQDGQRQGTRAKKNMGDIAGFWRCAFKENVKQRLCLCSTALTENDEFDARRLIWQGISNNVEMSLNINEYKSWNVAMSGNWNPPNVFLYDMLYFDSYNEPINLNTINKLANWGFYFGDRYLSGGAMRGKSYSFDIKVDENINGADDYRWATHYGCDDVVYCPFVEKWTGCFSRPSDSDLTQSTALATVMSNCDIHYDWITGNAVASNAGYSGRDSRNWTDTTSSYASAHPGSTLTLPFNKGVEARPSEIRLFDVNDTVDCDGNKFNLPDMSLTGGMYLGTYMPGDTIEYRFEINGWTDTNGTQSPEFDIYLSSKQFEGNVLVNEASFKTTSGDNMWTTFNGACTVSVTMPDDITEIFAQIVPHDQTGIGKYRFYVDTHNNTEVTIIK